MSFDHLFTPIKVGNVTFKNRIGLAPMGVCLNPDSNEIDERTIAYFEARAKGGIGYITSSPACIDEDLCGIADVGQYYLTRKEHVEGIKKICNAVHKYDTKIAIQLLHPGRQGASYMSHGQQPVAPSALKEADFDWLEMPRELSVDEIKSLVQKYIQGAIYAYEGGADGVELHGAHGYLIHQFMSPRANKREDMYGGSFENRMRFITEIIHGIKAIQPENTFLSVRINAIDFLEDGIQIEEGKKIALYLQDLGIDAISISGGTYSCQDALIEPQIQEEGWRSDAYLKECKGLLHIPVFAANHIKRPATAETMLKEGICDVVLLGRQSMADPNWSKKAQEGRADQIRYCISCNHCTDQVSSGKPVKCSVNPYLSKEADYNEKTIVKNGNGRKVVVIGGGPAGMEAALIASRKGFSTTLIEASGSLGGAIALPRVAHGMSKVGYTVDGFVSRIMASDVNIKLNTKITSIEQIKALNPYALIIATGGKPAKFNIPGIEKPHVVQAHDVLKAPNLYKNKKVILIGSGMTGLETAEVLVGNGCNVDIFEMQDEIAKGANMKNKYALMNYLVKEGAHIHLNSKLTEIKDNYVSFENTNTKEIKKYESELVVLSMGVKADTTLFEMCKDKFDHVIAIGDCNNGKLVVDATRDALDAVWNLE